MDEEIWSTVIDEELIEKYSAFFNYRNGIQIAIIILAGVLFILILLIYGIIRCFDHSVKPSIPTNYFIRFDPKGFSSNELRLYNLKSIDSPGGCRLKSIKPTQKGRAGVLQAEKMFDPPMPRLDPICLPWIGYCPTSSTNFHVVDWNDFFDYPAEEAAHGTGESVATAVAPSASSN